MRNSVGTVIDRPYGDNSVYGTNSPEVANGIAGSKYGPGSGGVFEVELPKDAKILDLNKEFTPQARSIVEAVLQEAKTQEAMTADGSVASRSVEPIKFDGVPGRQVYDQITDAVASGDLHANTMDVLASELNRAGFDGARFDTGQGGSSHAVTMIFDPEKTGDAGGKVKEVGRYAPDRERIPGPTMDDLQASIEEQKSIKSHALYDEQAHEHLSSLEKAPPQDILQPNVDARMAELHEEISAAKAEGKLTPEMEKAFQRIDENFKAESDHDSIIKAALHCMTRGE
jgi:hypothetical protein